MNKIKKILTSSFIAIALVLGSTDIIHAEEEPGGFYFGLPWGDSGCFVIGLCKIIW